MVCTNGDKGTSETSVKPEELAKTREKLAGTQKPICDHPFLLRPQSPT